MINVADSNAVSYYHFDGLGSVVALSDSDGDSIQSYEYSIYGQVAAEDPNHPNPYMFTGRRFDFETGLYYYRARYYNPYIGRFLQTDPVGYGAGMNLYRYCRNNPLGFVDPSGLWEYTFLIPAGYFPDVSDSTARTLVNAFLKEQGFYEDYEGWEIQDVVSNGCGWDVTLFSDRDDVCEPDFDTVSMPIWEGPRDKYSVIDWVDVLTLDGIGLLNDAILSTIIAPAINRVNSWDFSKGHSLGYDLFNNCDTAFWLAVKIGKRPDYRQFQFDVTTWRFQGEDYHYSEINFLLLGYACKKAGLSLEQLYLIYHLRENIQGWIRGEWIRTPGETEGGALWLCYGYDGL